LNQLHHLLQKEACFEKGLVLNFVEDSFSQVHHEEVEFEFVVVLLWIAKLASMLQYTAKFICH
jgi:hypothetical protein